MNVTFKGLRGVYVRYVLNVYEWQEKNFQPVAFRYVAVCFPLLHRDLSYTYSVTTRVFAYTIPVITLSVLTNIPKFFETQLVVETAQVPAVKNETTGKVIRYANMTTYTIDVTDLRNNPIYIKYYMNITRTVVLAIIPFVALIYFNVKIYLRFLITRGRYSRQVQVTFYAWPFQSAHFLLVKENFDFYIVLYNTKGPYSSCS